MQKAGQLDVTKSIDYSNITSENLEVFRLRVRLILEETFELIEALVTKEMYSLEFQPQLARLYESLDRITLQDLSEISFEGIADATTDQQYILLGNANAFGINLDACFQEVHRSNMTKFENGKAILDNRGKLKKGKDYKPPNLTPLLTRDMFNILFN